MYGERLKEARNAKGLSLIAASFKLNIDNTTLSRYENEKREPSITILKEMCDFYNVSADYILGLSEEKLIRR